MDLNKLTKPQLIKKCKELKIKGYSNLNKANLVKLVKENQECEKFKNLENINSKKYIFGDYDKDSIPNIDDETPFIKSDKSVQEILLSDELKELHKARDQVRPIYIKTVKTLKSFNVGKVESRIKSEYSIINSLRKWQLLPSKDTTGLNDLIGTRLVLPSYQDLKNAMKFVESKFEIEKVKDKYKSPFSSGYRAVHYVLKDKNSNQLIELQLQTERVNEFAYLIHTLYKTDKLDEDKSKAIFQLISKADLGNRKAQMKYALLMNDKKKLLRNLTKVEKKRRSNKEQKVIEELID